MVFDNPVAKVQQFLDAMEAAGAHPEFECFEVGIVRSVGMFLKAGMLKAGMGTPEYNLVMGVASGMPCDADLLALLPRWIAPGAVWQATLIGREEIWPVHQKTAELGGRAAHRPGGQLLPAWRRTRERQRPDDRSAGEVRAARGAADRHAAAGARAAGIGGRLSRAGVMGNEPSPRRRYAYPVSTRARRS